MIVSLLYKIKPLTRHNENKLAWNTQTIHTKKKKRLKVLYLIYNLWLIIYLFIYFLIFGIFMFY